MRFRIALNFLIPPFKKYELTLLKAVSDRMDDKFASILIRRINDINYIQRLSHNKMVHMYHIENGHVVFDKSDRLPIDTEDWKVASVTFHAGSRIFHSDLWAVNGYLFSLDFDRVPSMIKNVSIVIDDVHLFKFHPKTISNYDIAELSKLDIPEWIKKISWKIFEKPIDYDKNSEYLSFIYAKLPDDYINILNLFGGLESECCKIFGSQDIKKIVFKNTSFYVIAELKGIGFLVVEMNGKDGEILFIDFEDNEPIKLGKSISKAMGQKIFNSPGATA